MRILFLAPDVNLLEHDGQATHTLGIARAFARLGNDVLLLVGRNGTYWVEEGGLQVAVIRNIGLGARHDALKAASAFHPAAIYERRTTPKLGSFVAKKLGLSCSLEINGLVELEGARIRLSSRVLGEVWRRRLYHRCDRIFVPSRGLASALEAFHNISQSKIAVVPNGVDLSLFKPMEQREARLLLGWPDDSKIVCFVGKMEIWQGLGTLVQAAGLMRSIEGLRVVLAGDGPLVPSLRRQVRELGLEERVLFLGSLPYPRVPIILAASDVCAAPFARERNDRIGISPIKLFEYMAMGRAIVTTDVAGVREVVRDAGIIVHPDSPFELARALEELLRDPTRAEAMGSSGLAYAKHCSWERRAMTILEAISGAAASRAEVL